MSPYSTSRSGFLQRFHYILWKLRLLAISCRLLGSSAGAQPFSEFCAPVGEAVCEVFGTCANWLGPAVAAPAEPPGQGRPDGGDEGQAGEDGQKPDGGRGAVLLLRVLDRR